MFFFHTSAKCLNISKRICASNIYSLNKKVKGTQKINYNPNSQNQTTS